MMRKGIMFFTTVESFSANAYHHAEDKDIHSNFTTVKIHLPGWLLKKTQRIWTWGGAPSSNPISFLG